jgi:hypothetical protein
MFVNNWVRIVLARVLLPPIAGEPASAMAFFTSVSTPIAAMFDDPLAGFMASAAEAQ